MGSFLFSCENATHAVPSEHGHLFSGQDELLSSAEGWEPGALNLAQACAMRFRTPLVDAETSRLLLNVEAAKDECWSRFSEALSDFDKRRLLERYWQSYRNELHRRIRGDIERHSLVFHVMVHTNPDQREHLQLHVPEKSVLAEEFGEACLTALQRGELRCALRSGKLTSDLADELTKTHAPEQYAQIRMSVHQDFFLMGTPWRWDTIKKHLLDALAISANRVETVVHG